MLKHFSIALFAAAAWAADPASLQREGYVNDFAGVLSAETKQEIGRYLKRVDDSAKAQIAIVTIPSLDGQPIEDFSIELARRWGVGYKNPGGAAAGQSDQGVLVLFAIRDRKMRIETGYGVEDAIPDGFAGELLRSARPALRTGNYNAALAQIAHTLGERIAAKRNVAITDSIPRVRRVRDDAIDIPWPVIVVGLLLLFWFLRNIGGGGRGGGRYRRYGGGPGVIWMPPIGGGGWGGGGSSSSGGFGGYDSSDSFGGFGGGDFGGGGASSDW